MNGEWRFYVFSFIIAIECINSIGEVIETYEILTLGMDGVE